MENGNGVYIGYECGGVIYLPTLSPFYPVKIETSGDCPKCSKLHPRPVERETMNEGGIR